MSTTSKAIGTKTNKTATVAVSKKLSAPKKAPNAFTAFVATQKATTAKAETATHKAAEKTTIADTGVAVQNEAKATFARTEQNGRKDYAPHTVGALIWQTATTLQALTPNTPITSGQVRTALPDVKPASVSAGLSHWRKFNGTMRVKEQGAPTTV